MIEDERTARPQKWVPTAYMEIAIKFLLEHGAAGLFLDPGLRKTSITLAAFKILKHEGLAERMLVIAPLRPAYLVWPREILKWAEFNELRCVVLHGKTKRIFQAKKVALPLQLIGVMNTQIRMNPGYIKNLMS